MEKHPFLNVNWSLFEASEQCNQLSSLQLLTQHHNPYVTQKLFPVVRAFVPEVETILFTFLQ